MMPKLTEQGQKAIHFQKGRSTISCQIALSNECSILFYIQHINCLWNLIGQTQEPFQQLDQAIRARIGTFVPSLGIDID